MAVQASPTKGMKTALDMEDLFVGKVIGARRVSPNFIRVTVSFSHLNLFETDFVRFRLVLRRPGSSCAWPDAEHSGEVISYNRGTGFHSRVYTISTLDPRNGVVGFDVFLHGRGFSCAWALNPLGDEIGLLPLGVDWLPRPFSHLLIFGDETALPAITQICNDLSDNRTGRTTVCVGCAEDVPVFRCPTGVDLKVLARENDDMTLLRELK